MYTRFFAKCCITLAAGLFLIACDDDPEPKPTSSFKIEVRAYNESSHDFESTPATLTVRMENLDEVTKELSAETTTIEVPESKIYTVTISKTNYFSYGKTFSASELEQFNNSPLVVKLILESINNGMIAFFPFNGNANDSTHNLYLGGTVYGATLSTGRKGFDACYYFDGVDDYIKVPNQTQLNTSGDFAISVWTAVSSTQIGTEGINDIIRKWNGNTEGYPLCNFVPEYKCRRCRMKTSLSMFDTMGRLVHMRPHRTLLRLRTMSLYTSYWLKRGLSLRQYLNGNLIQEFTDNTSCSTTNTADLTIGCRGNLVRYFKGKIDDIRIYGRSVSEAEVASLYVE